MMSELSTDSAPAAAAADVPQAATEKKEKITVMQILDYYFHQKTFKSEKQAEAINAVLTCPNDVFVSMPDCSGRSMCYQLPAMLKSPKITIVFCSLLHRIKQHMRSLTRLKLHTNTLNSTIEDHRRMSVMQDVCKNTTRYSILYVTPDEVGKEDFMQFVKHLYEANRLAYMVLDEVQCEKRWLFHQRREYESLGNLRNSYPDVKWVVLTAEVGKEVVDMIKETLNLKTDWTGEVKRIGTVNNRSNVYYDVVHDISVMESLANMTAFIEKSMTAKDFITTLGTKPSGLIYCKTKEIISYVCAAIRPKNAVVRPYHSGLTEKQQTSARIAFMKGTVQVLVVTGSFGLSINKSNVRFILHWGVPLSILSYYNETCVAGRDGGPVRCRIYCTNSTLFFFDGKWEKEMEERIRNAENAKQEENFKAWYLVFVHSRYAKEYAMTNKCRHSFLYNYFGETKGRCNSRCNVCAEEWRQFYYGRNLILRSIGVQGLSHFMRSVVVKYDTYGYERMLTGDTLYLMKVCDEIMKNASVIAHPNIMQLFNKWRTQLILMDNAPEIDVTAVLDSDAPTDPIFELIKDAEMDIDTE